MIPLIVLAAIVAAPLVLASFLRVNAALLFLSLCLGDVLVQFVAGDANLLLSSVSQRATPNIIKLVVLLIPVVFTVVFMIRTTKKSLLVLNVLPALGTGFLAALLIVPLLSSSLSRSIMASSAWIEGQKLQDMVVAASALVSLFFLIMQRPRSSQADKHEKKH